MNFHKKKIKIFFVLTVAVISCILIFYFSSSARKFGTDLKAISSSSKKAILCELRQQLARDQCREIDLVDIANGVSRGGLTLPPSKAKIKEEYMLIFYDQLDRKNCYLLIDYESEDLNLIINDIVPRGDCTGIKKYLTSYYEIDTKSLRSE